MKSYPRSGGQRAVRELVADAMAGFDERRERAQEKRRRENALARARRQLRAQAGDRGQGSGARPKAPVMTASS